MKNAVRLWAALAASVALLAAIGISADVYAEVPAAPAIGAVMPNFKLTDIHGKEHTLEQYKGKIVVLDFSSIQCPYSKGVDPSLNELSKTYGEKGVVFLGINANAGEAVDAIAAYSAEAKVPHTVLKDPDSAYADAVGAKVTPEIYVIDPEMKLAYHGAPDNRTGPTSEASETYLKDALDALLAGEAVKVTTNRAWGCGIKRSHR